MPAERFYTPRPFLLQKNVTLDHDENHHLVRVMRARVGSDIELINGKGQLAKGIVEEIGKHESSIKIIDVKNEDVPSCQLIIAQAMVRQNRLDIIIEKGTELGMSALWLFPGDLSEKSELSMNQIERCRNLSISALKQCGALFLPEIELLPSLDKWDPVDNAFFGDIRTNAPKLINVIKPDLKKIIFFVGPEKGFSEAEEALLDKIAQGVSLHKNILRTETASLCALSQISAFMK